MTIKLTIELINDDNTPCTTHIVNYNLNTPVGVLLACSSVNDMIMDHSDLIKRSNTACEA